MSSPLPIELVIFDCDGVLIDSEIISARVLLSHLASVGVHVDFNHFQTNFMGRSWPKVVADIRINYGLALDAEFEETYRRELLEVFARELKPTPGIETVLDQLGVPFCLATSSSPKRVARSLELTGLAKFFTDRCFTASQVPNGKPAPDLFLLAASTMAVDPAHCLVIEDSAPGIEAARRANMRHYRYTGGQHFNGLDTSSLNSPDRVEGFSRWSDFFDLEPELQKMSRGQTHGWQG